MDSETGLYYYGARYLDPKYSHWLSPDPAMGKYIPEAPVNDEAKKHNENLPGQGGVFNTVNLQVYHYAGNNPIVYTDPNGEFKTKQFVFAFLQTAGGTFEVAAAGSGGISIGASIYATVDGVYNIADGITGMVTAADKDYSGAIPEVSMAIADKAGATEDQKDLVGDIAGLADSVVDLKATGGVSLAKGVKTASKMIKALDKINTANGISGVAKNAFETLGATEKELKVNKLTKEKDETE